MRTFLLATIFLFACAPAPKGGGSGHGGGGGGGDDCGQDGPLGTPAQLTIAPGAESGPRIEPPQLCDGEGSSKGAYLRVYGGGSRRLVMGAAGFENGCKEPPPPGAPADVCPEIFADAIAKAVLERLTSEGVHGDSIGLGVCGMPTGFDLDVWKFSVSVHDWKDADAGVRAIDAELRRWGAGGSLGLSVRGIDCVEPF